MMARKAIATVDRCCARACGKSDGMFDGMPHGMFDGMLHGMFDGMLHGMFDGMLHGMFDGMLHGMFNGMLHGMFNGMPPAIFGPRQRSSKPYALVIHRRGAKIIIGICRYLQLFVGRADFFVLFQHNACL